MVSSLTLHTNLMIRQNHFVNTCVNDWNVLNDNIVCVSSFAVFRKRQLLCDEFNLRGHALNA